MGLYNKIMIQVISYYNETSPVTQAAADEAERLVVSKMKRQDYINVYVEDASDWKHGITREIVQKADPDFSRRLSNTKLGSRLSQLRSPNDVMDFIEASGLLTSFLLTNLLVRFTPLHSEMII